jgi:hypothetical protein
LALGDGDAAEVRSAPGAQGRRPEMFSVTTPPLKLKAGGAQSDTGVAAPHRYPLELGRDGPVGGWAAVTDAARERSDDSPTGGSPLLVTKRLHGLLEAADMAESESSQDAIERLDSLAEHLQHDGVRSEQVEVALNLERFVIDVTRRWKQESLVHGSREPIAR